MTLPRPDGREPNQLRPIHFQRGYTKYGAASVLASFGDTRVLCTVSVQEGVPRFLEGTGKGWLTAEYRMLPNATDRRHSRELLKLSGRTQEIQRLIGRSLRASLDLQKLGELTITVDADVLQADAGTRTASVTGGYVALVDAVQWAIAKGLLAESPLRDRIAAVSVGLLQGEVYLDLCYEEDSKADVDLNVVMNQRLEAIEIQGTAEHQSFSRAQLNQMLEVAETGIEQLLNAQQEALSNSPS